MVTESAFVERKEGRGDARPGIAARKCMPWAAALLLVSGLALAGVTSALVTPTLRDSEAFLLGRAAVTAHPEVEAQFGSPLSTGTPSGGIHVSGQDGDANLQFGVAGPKGRGTAYVEAHRGLGPWDIEHLVVENDNGARIQVR